jgi:hypothetical protein
VVVLAVGRALFTATRSVGCLLLVKCSAEKVRILASFLILEIQHGEEIHHAGNNDVEVA